MQKVILLEDEKSLSEMIKMNLELDGFQVEVFDDGQIAMENLSKFISADLVILDVMVPKISGLDICKEIRKTSKTPILILSAKGTTIDRITGLKIGANDYLAKPFDLEELLLRIQNLLPKEEDEDLIIGNLTINFSTFEIHNSNKEVISILSKKEIELLKLFREKQGQVVSRNEILDKIWPDQFPTSRTIDNYILSFRKLFEKDPKNPIHFHSIRGVGYKFQIG
ncbi:response regulator transcription factor [Crocinitomicaceae bacterium]|nr:response regulator transcription factor [Crocinitomicaceae bacterium]